ncbi:unnamed protein product [Arctogadus glacialis]
MLTYYWPKMSFSTSFVLTHHIREGPPLCDPSTDTPCLTHIRRNKLSYPSILPFSFSSFLCCIESLRAWMRMLYSSGHEVSRPS